MDYNKEFGTAAAEEIDEITADIENGTETVTGETEEPKEEAYTNMDREELKQRILDLASELARGAREVVELVRRNVPNKTLRLLIKIGLGIAVFNVMDGWLGRILITAGVLYWVFGKDLKEHVK